MQSVEHCTDMSRSKQVPCPMCVNTTVRRCCRSTQYSSDKRVLMERVWLYRMCVQKHHKMHDRSKPATTTTMKRSEKKIEYPDPSKKSNLLQYLTILEIEHNNTQTIKDLTKLLPKHWRKALPDDWESKFSPPSATKPHRTRSGSSNITPTHTLSEGNAESSATGEASPEHPEKKSNPAP